MRQIKQQVTARESGQSLGHVEVGLIHALNAVAPDIAEFTAQENQQATAKEIVTRKIGLHHRHHTQVISQKPVAQDQEAPNQTGHHPVTQSEQRWGQPEPGKGGLGEQGIRRPPEPSRAQEQHRDEQHLHPLATCSDEFGREPL